MGKEMNLEEQFNEFKENFTDENWLDFLTGVLDINTYDGELDIIIMKGIVDVLKSILDRTTYQYQNDISTRLIFVTVCHLPYIASRIEWGTSIRGAWADGENSEKDFRNILDFYNNHHTE